jgi:type 1 glutamine amidotransferase
MKDKVLLFIVSLGLLFFIVLSSGIAQNQFEVLVYAHFDTYHKDATHSALNSFKTMALKHHFGLTWTQDTSIFTSEKLKNYAAVVFLNANGNTFNDEQREAFKQYINNGGGFVGLHAASITNQKWLWYDQLVGRLFTGHPRIQSGVLQVVDMHFPATFHLPGNWIWTDEWYNFGEAKSDDLQTLLKVDESTYNPKGEWRGEEIKVMGDFHPVAWYQEFDGGRSFYSGLGHKPELYNDLLHLDFIYGGIYWAATGRGIFIDTKN